MNSLLKTSFPLQAVGDGDDDDDGGSHLKFSIEKMGTWLDIRVTAQEFIGLELEFFMTNNAFLKEELWAMVQDSPLARDQINTLRGERDALLTEMSILRENIIRQARLFQAQSWIHVTDLFDLYALVYIAKWEAKDGFFYFKVDGNEDCLSVLNRLSLNKRLMTLADDISSFDPTALYRIKKHMDVVKIELEEDEGIERALTPRILP